MVDFYVENPQPNPGLWSDCMRQLLHESRSGNAIVHGLDIQQNTAPKSASSPSFPCYSRIWGRAGLLTWNGFRGSKGYDFSG